MKRGGVIYMKNILKNYLQISKKQRKTYRKNKAELKSQLELKELHLAGMTGKKRIKKLKKYYKKSFVYKTRWKWILLLRKMERAKLPLWISFIRWVLIDFLRGKAKRKFGIFQFVALPGEGKTMSMVAHMERFRNEYNKKGKPFVIASNFSYRYNNFFINHWSEMVEIAKNCYKESIPCLIALDEIHVTFDSSDWKNFPPAVLAMLSFNRKYGLEFLCSSQIYERIPKKIRDIANYTVICKNIGHFDRLFRCYYFPKSDYEAQFEGKKKKAQYIKEYIADNNFYALYDTLEQVDIMTAQANEEKNLQQKAFDILFGNNLEEAE